MKLLSDEEEEAVLDFLTNEYGSTGCRVFEWGYKIGKIFPLKINISKGNY